MFVKTFNAVRNHARELALLAATSAPMLALAQTTDPFTQVQEDAIEKVTTYGGGLVLIAAAGVLFGIAIKYVKRVRGAS